MTDIISLQNYALVINAIVIEAAAVVLLAWLVTCHGYQCRLVASAGREILVRQRFPECKACRFVER